jgi:hypothetical protein
MFNSADSLQAETIFHSFQIINFWKMQFNTFLSYATGNEGLLARQRQLLFLRDNRIFLHQMNARLVQMELV